MKIVSKVLAIFSALSFSLSSPVQAQQNELQNVQAKIKEQMKDSKFKNAKIFDGDGKPTTLEAAMNNPDSFRKGIAIEDGQQRFEMRGELLNDGKDGVMLMGTFEIPGKRKNGQMIRLTPGMSKLEMESVLETFVVSLTTDYDTAMKPGPKRSIAASRSAMMACMVFIPLSLMVTGINLIFVQGAVSERSALAFAALFGFSVLNLLTFALTKKVCSDA